MSGLHFHPLRVHEVRPDGEGAVVVSFDVPPDLRGVFGFTQGQYLTLRKTIGDLSASQGYVVDKVEGFDRGRYATDASFYQIMPAGVVLPIRPAQPSVESGRNAFGSRKSSSTRR